MKCQKEFLNHHRLSGHVPQRGEKKKSPVRESEEERGKKSAGRQRGWTEDVQCAVEDRLRWEGPCSFGIKSRLIKLINAR